MNQTLRKNRAKAITAFPKGTVVRYMHYNTLYLVLGLKEKSDCLRVKDCGTDEEVRPIWWKYLISVHPLEALGALSVESELSSVEAA